MTCPPHPPECCRLVGYSLLGSELAWCERCGALADVDREIRTLHMGTPIRPVDGLPVITLLWRSPDPDAAGSEPGAQMVVGRTDWEPGQVKP